MRIRQLTLEELMEAIGKGELFNENRKYYIVATKTNKLIPVKQIPMGQIPGWAKFNDAAFIVAEFTEE